jgi:hypothetical protein
MIVVQVGVKTETHIGVKLGAKQLNTISKKLTKYLQDKMRLSVNWRLAFLLCFADGFHKIVYNCFIPTRPLF